MTKKQFSIVVLFTAALALVAAYAAGPYVGAYFNGPDRMAAAWADNYDTLDQMTTDVDAVVVATVSSVYPGRQVATGSGALLPFTNIELEVERTLSGEAASVITVEQTGGRVGSATFYVDGDGGLYEIGDRVMLFLKRQPESDFYYLVNPQGRFHVQAGRLDAIDPEAAVARDLHGRPLGEVVDLIVR